MKIKRHGPRSTPNLRQRFFIWSAVILLGGGVLLSALSFWNTRRLLMAEAMTKSEVILREVEAIRSYVKEELRPKMFELHGRDTFIIEAMSTTYISTRIMARFAESMPNYIYRRASLNPHNPRNLADFFEEEMFDWFESDPTRLFWQGIVKKNGDSYFVSMVPDYFSPSCIRCHGKAEDAPHELTDRYGTDGGFRFQTGDLAGINSVAIPVSASLREAWQGSISLFMITLGGSVLLLWLLNLLFQRLVIERLGVMLTLISEKKKGAAKHTTGDEIDILQASLGSLRRYVSSARKGSSLQPNFINNYVVTQPIAACSMSWLFHGYEAKTEKKISLKIGFEEVLQNPLYRACFETEMQLFETMSHPCLPKVKERVEDTLILEEIQGKSLSFLQSNEGLDNWLLLPVFSQLCDLTASLHSAGIVHHDLRPHILMLDEQQKIRLIDMGLAANDQQEDPITAAGLGPQGDLLYMAPELIQGKRGNSCSDIYGLGIILYLALSGSLPYSEKRCSPQKWLQKKEQIIPLAKQRTGLSAALEQVVEKALAFDSNERYQWVEDFWEDLEQAIRKDQSIF
jgi:HAMP domain-containing protein